MFRETKRTQSMSIRVQIMNTKIQKDPNTKLSLQRTQKTAKHTDSNIYTTLSSVERMEAPNLYDTKSEQRAPKGALCKVKTQQ